MIDINRLVESKRVEITFVDHDVNKELVKSTGSLVFIRKFYIFYSEAKSLNYRR